MHIAIIPAKSTIVNRKITGENVADVVVVSVSIWSHVGGDFSKLTRYVTIKVVANVTIVLK